jgi:WD40 repeat protein
VRGVTATADAALDEAWSIATDEYPTALAFASDGRCCAIGDAGGTVVVVDAAEGRVLARHSADAAGVLALAWQPGTRRLAVGGQSGVVALYGADGCEAETPLDGGWLERLAWQPDGRRLVAVQGRTLHQLDADGRRLASSAPQASTLTGLAFRAGGRQIVTCCYGGVAVHDAGSLAVTRRFRWNGSLIALALSPNDRVVAAGLQDATVHFWRFADGRDAQMSGYAMKPKSLAFSADSQWLATSGGPAVIVWPFDGRGPEGREPLLLPEHPAPVEWVAYAPRSAGLVSGCRAGELRLWVPPVRREPLAVKPLGHAVAGLAWGADGDDERLAVADAGGTVRGWTL